MLYLPKLCLLLIPVLQPHTCEIARCQDADLSTDTTCLAIRGSFQARAWGCFWLAMEKHTLVEGLAPELVGCWTQFEP